MRVAEDKAQSNIARASALERLARVPNAEALDLASKALKNDDVLIRRAAIPVRPTLTPHPTERLAPLLHDTTRLVRMEAARALAGRRSRDCRATISKRSSRRWRNISRVSSSTPSVRKVTRTLQAFIWRAESRARRARNIRKRLRLIRPSTCDCRVGRIHPRQWRRERRRSPAAQGNGRESEVGRACACAGA